MIDDPALDLRHHVADAVRHLRAGRTDTARWAAIFAGVAAARIARASGGDVIVAVPPELGAAPLDGWFRMGAEMVSDRFVQPAKPDHGDFHVRPGANPAARAYQEDE